MKSDQWLGVSDQWSVTSGQGSGVKGLQKRFWGFILCFAIFLSLPINAQAEAPVLEFTKKVTLSGTVSLGATLTYTLEFINTGQGTATEVVITDAIPPGTTYITNSAGGDNATITYSHNGGIDYDSEQTVPVTHIRWNLTKDIPPGASGSVYFDVRVE